MEYFKEKRLDDRELRLVEGLTPSDQNFFLEINIYGSHIYIYQLHFRTIIVG